MRYVLLTLVGGHKLYSKDKFFKGILELNIPPEEIWISTTESLFSEFTDGYKGNIPIVWIHGEEDLGDDMIRSTTSAREALRQKFVESDYEWSMWLDSDIIVTQDMVEVFLDHLKNNNKLTWVHGYHPWREGEGIRSRHGLGSCFIHRYILSSVPFIRIQLPNGNKYRNLGDDYIWIKIVASCEELGWVDAIHGKLWDLGHMKRDGTIVRYKNFL